MTLHLYFARKFATIFGSIFAVFFVLMALIDMVEQMRRFSASDIGFGAALELSLLATPQVIYRIIPLLVVLATVALFLGLARSSEMVVTRASGRSALRALIAPMLTAVLIGVLGVLVLNPIVAATQARYEVRAESYRVAGAISSVLSVSEDGLWMRQGSDAGQTVIRATRANLDGTVFYGVTFLDFDTEGRPVRRIEAADATLGTGEWVLQDAKIWPLTVLNPEAAARREALVRVPSSLTREQIRDSFGTPSAIPIWDLPAFIEDLDRAGFSARLHRVWLQMELATPLFLAGMVLIGAGFTLRHTRFGRTGQMVLLALGLGLAAYFIRSFAQILGETGQIPVWLAAWAPPVAAVMLSLGLLLHLEDG
jgi:lipopolysaccharide export system permease protein